MFKSKLIIIAPTFLSLVLIGAGCAKTTQVTKPNSKVSGRSTQIKLPALTGSNQSGTATITELGSKVSVAITLDGAISPNAKPAHIHVGSCPNPGAVKYPLTNVINGRSQTTLGVSWDELFKLLPLAINVHKSFDEPKTSVACGNILGL